MTIIKSDNDQKSYRYFTLENGLKILLIYDSQIEANPSKTQETTEEDVSETASSESSEENGEKSSNKKAAFAIAVGIGSYSDPDNIEGLAHYLEHMLFMGSEKYPKENEYDSFVHVNGGFTNAYTDADNTVYICSLNNSGLYGALDRLSSVFIAPLFLEDSLDREVKSVDSEFSNYIQSDYRRTFHIVTNAAKEGHVVKRFVTGNLESLSIQPKKQNINIRDALIKFYKEHYSAERMCLSVIGGHSLDVMENWVKELFSPIPNGLGPSPSFHHFKLPYNEKKFLLLPSIKDKTELYAYFQFPPIRKEYRKKAEQYIAYLIGHEGPGSLLSALKSRNWALELMSDVENYGFTSNTFCCILEVNITLTDKGIEAGQGFGMAVLSMLFQYIKLLMVNGPQKWIYDELHDIGKMTFKFLEDIHSYHYAMNVASDMLNFPEQDVLCHEYIYNDWDSEKVKDFLSHLDPLNSEGFCIALRSKKYQELKDNLKNITSTPNETKLLKSVTEKYDKYYAFTYQECVFDPSLLEQFKNQDISNDLYLPPKNPYLPSNFTLLEDKSENNNNLSNDSDNEMNCFKIKPKLALDELGIRVWYKLDALHKTPKLTTYFWLSSGNTDDTLKSFIHTLLISHIWEQLLNEECYLAETANLNVNFSSKGTSGLAVRITGFNHKLPLLIKIIFEKLKEFKVSEDVFENSVNIIKTHYKNSDTKVENHLNHLRLYILIKKYWRNQDILKELENITMDNIKKYFEQFMHKTHLECLFYGNITEKDTLEITKQTREIISGENLNIKDRLKDACAKIEPGTTLIIEPTVNPEAATSGIGIYFQCGNANIQNKAYLDMFEQITEEAFYNTLRTKEQLGYITFVDTKCTNDILGFLCLIISDLKHPQYVEDRIEHFLKQYEKTIMEMDDKEFEENKNSIISSILELDKSQKETASRLWAHVITEKHDFQEALEEAEAIAKITKKDIHEWYKKYISEDSKERRKLSLHITCPKHFAENEQWKSENIKDIYEYKKKLEYYPENVNYNKLM